MSGRELSFHYVRPLGQGNVYVVSSGPFVVGTVRELDGRWSYEEPCVAGLWQGDFATREEAGEALGQPRPARRRQRESYRIKLRGMYAGPAQPDGARPGPDQEFYEADWVVPLIPAIGDTLILPDRDGGDQDLLVSERVIYPDRIEVWVGSDFAGWDKASVASLFESARRWTTKDRQP